MKVILFREMNGYLKIIDYSYENQVIVTSHQIKG